MSQKLLLTPIFTVSTNAQRGIRTKQEVLSASSVLILGSVVQRSSPSQHVLSQVTTGFHFSPRARWHLKGIQISTEIRHVGFSIQDSSSPCRFNIHSCSYMYGSKSPLYSSCPCTSKPKEDDRRCSVDLVSLARDTDVAKEKNVRCL